MSLCLVTATQEVSGPAEGPWGWPTTTHKRESRPGGGHLAGEAQEPSAAGQAPPRAGRAAPRVPSAPDHTGGSGGGREASPLPEPHLGSIECEGQDCAPTSGRGCPLPELCGFGLLSTRVLSVSPPHPGRRQMAWTGQKACGGLPRETVPSLSWLTKQAHPGPLHATPRNASHTQDVPTLAGRLPGGLPFPPPPPPAHGPRYPLCSSWAA